MVKAYEVIIIGGGLAGLSAAVYLGRQKRRTLLIDSGKSMAVWEPDVQNYLGFAEGISGEELLRRGREQAQRFGTEFCTDTIVHASGSIEAFRVVSQTAEYTAQRLLLATGIFHVPPAIPALDACLGHSMFFCKDCDGHRVQGKRVAIIGSNNEAVEYALGMLLYTPRVCVLSNGGNIQWDEQHDDWLREYEIPFLEQAVEHVEHDAGQLRSIVLVNRKRIELDALFTTRGDVVHNDLAKDLRARLDKTGEVIVDDHMKSSVPGLYAAGCITPSNCQMIIAAGEGAIAAQAINRDLFEQSLRNHKLRRTREEQLQTEQTEVPCDD